MAEPCEYSYQSTPNGFLSLPFELREQIYELLVVKPRTTITMLDNFDCYKSEVSACQPAISMVNHQLRTESLATFYSNRNNLFLAEVSYLDDLTVAKRWLNAIGDVNVGHLRRLALCGWTRVPFGHMCCRRWVKATFDLKTGYMDVAGEGPGVYDGMTIMGQQCEHPEITRGVSDLRASFYRMVESREGKRFGVVDIASLMEGFHVLCAYW